MKNLKLRVAESMGICETQIKYLVESGEGVCVQFDDDVRGVFTVDHDEDEYVYLNTNYGLSEVYDFIKIGEGECLIGKMDKISEYISKEEIGE